MTHWTCNHRSRRGTATVEFAIALPILLLFFCAAIEFSRVSMVKHVVDNASYEACRAVIVPGASVAEGTAAAAQVAARFGVTGLKVSVTPNPILESTSTVTVAVSAPAFGNSWGISKFTGGVNLASTTTLLTERSPTIQATAVPTPPPPTPPTPTPKPTPKPKKPKKPKPTKPAKPTPKPAKPTPKPKPKPTPKQPKPTPQQPTPML